MKFFALELKIVLVKEASFCHFLFSVLFSLSRCHHLVFQNKKWFNLFSLFYFITYRTSWILFLLLKGVLSFFFLIKLVFVWISKLFIKNLDILHREKHLILSPSEQVHVLQTRVVNFVLTLQASKSQWTLLIYKLLTIVTRPYVNTIYLAQFSCWVQCAECVIYPCVGKGYC